MSRPRKNGRTFGSIKRRIICVEGFGSLAAVTETRNICSQNCSLVMDLTGGHHTDRIVFDARDVRSETELTSQTAATFGGTSFQRK